MAYGRTRVPPPATPFEEFMATASEKMIAAKIDFIEFLRTVGDATGGEKIEEGFVGPVPWTEDYVI